jgi:AraC-like DNA-binding protein
MSGHTVLSALSAAVLEAAPAVGFDADELRAAAGIDPATLADPDGRVPLEQHLALWSILSNEPVGLQIGARLGIDGLGVVGYAMQHGETVGEALAWLWRYRAVVHPDVVHPIELHGELALFTGPVPPPFARLREPVYAQASATVALMEALTGTAVRPRAVSLPLPEQDDDARLRPFFGCPVTWGAPALSVGFDASLLAQPLPRSDERLFGYLARRVKVLDDALPGETRFAERARREIGARLAQGEPRLGAIAQRLAVSERTLHRRLKEEGTRFASLVEEARRERAFMLLDDRHLSASEVAFLLGYAEPGAFFRAFRRWTKQTPREWRLAHMRPTSEA